MEYDQFKVYNSKFEKVQGYFFAIINFISLNQNVPRIHQVIDHVRKTI